MRPRLIASVLALFAAVAACSSVEIADPSRTPPEAVDPDRVVMNVTCGGPAFSVGVLEADGRAEVRDDPAVQALRLHLGGAEAEDFLPDHGWREAVRTDELAVFIADAPKGNEPPFVEVTLELVAGAWRVAGYGQCWPQADVGPGLGPASFRVAPHEELTPELTEIDVLVTERACNSGEDARGRIVEPAVITGPQTVTVVFGVVPREGALECPSNPETLFVLRLGEPLGDRALLDGSEVPPRDATICQDIGTCP